MHIEILTEDSSSQRLLEHLLPKVIGPHGQPHVWRFHSYRGIGRIPSGMSATSDPSKRILLTELPRLLKGYVKSAGYDAVVVVMDADNRDCVAFLAELKALAASCGASHMVLFRLAIEEIEAWYLGDRVALQHAYPNARMRPLDGYTQDSVCGTWELMAEAVHPGGVRAVKRAGWPLPGQIKHEWAERIGPFLDPERNLSPSFAKFRDGVRRLAGTPSSDHPMADVPP
jgi:hypothetical protein